MAPSNVCFRAQSRHLFSEMFIMVDVLRKPDGNKPGMMPAVIARRKSFPEHDSDLVRLRMLLIMQNKIYARKFNLSGISV